MKIRHGPATVTGELVPAIEPLPPVNSSGGKARGEQGSGSQETGLSPV